MYLAKTSKTYTANHVSLSCVYASDEEFICVYLYRQNIEKAWSFPLSKINIQTTTLNNTQHTHSLIIQVH